jgi:hypothetical protein
MFLVDTNVWLEVLLGQDKAGEAQEFLNSIEPSKLVLTDFTLYSIGIILTRLGKDQLFLDFTSDTLESGDVSSVRLTTEDLRDLIAVRQQFQLDFDDAYQYVAAEKYGVVLVSFDSDFDRTDRGRKTPIQVISIS